MLSMSLTEASGFFFYGDSISSRDGKVQHRADPHNHQAVFEQLLTLLGDTSETYVQQIINVKCQRDKEIPRTAFI